MARRLRALGDDRRRRGEEQNLGKCHYLIFCTITPDRVQLCSAVSIVSEPEDDEWLDVLLIYLYAMKLQITSLASV